MLANLDTPAAAPPPSDVLDLTEAMAAPAPRRRTPEPAATFRTIDAVSDVVFTDRPPERRPNRRCASVEERAPAAARKPPPRSTAG